MIPLNANGVLCGQLHTQVLGQRWQVLDTTGQLVGVVQRQNPWIKILDNTILRVPGMVMVLNVTRLMNLSAWLLRWPLTRAVVPPIYTVKAGSTPAAPTLLVARPRWGRWQLTPQHPIPADTLLLIRTALVQINQEPLN